VGDHQDPAASRMASRARHRPGNPGDHLVEVLAAWVPPVVVAGQPGVGDVQVRPPCLLVAAALKIADVQFPQVLQRRGGQPEAYGDDVRRLGRAA
jgi:hypothetical protein